MTNELTPTETARSAFFAFIAKLPESRKAKVEAMAMENTFSAECFKEYANDFARWEAALATAEMVIDQNWDK